MGEPGRRLGAGDELTAPGAGPGAPGTVFEPEVVPPGGDLGRCLFFAFRGDRLLFRPEPADGDGILPRAASFEEIVPSGGTPHYLGRRGDLHCFAVALRNDAEPPPGLELQDLRGLYGALDEETFQLAGRAFQILDWDRTHRFCGRCGAATGPHRSDRARQCPACGLLCFPRVAPAVITLIHKGEEFLLARNARFPEGRYSIIAGFVEPGETLEEAVAREIREEVGLQVTEIAYQSSQPWPFPHSLMVGFRARWAGGEIAIDDEEIVEAGWYSARRRPPSLPDPISISRRLIDDFLAEHP